MAEKSNTLRRKNVERFIFGIIAFVLWVLMLFVCLGIYGRLRSVIMRISCFTFAIFLVKIISGVENDKQILQELKKQEKESLEKARQLLDKHTYTPVKYIGDNINYTSQYESFQSFNYLLEAILNEDKVIYTILNKEGKREKLNYPDNVTFFINNFEKI